MKNLLLPLLLLAATSVQAQDDNFDLSSQRGEVQTVNRVPGHKVDHQGIVINPTPHEMTVDRTQLLDLSRGVVLRDAHDRFADDVDFLTTTNASPVRLTIDYGERKAAKAGVHATSGAYLLTVTKKGITITGYDERGAYYGLQTLRQLMGGQTDRVCYATINDWPDLPSRGVVEGFYGNPWSHQVRLSLIGYWGRNKLNTYVYGPKDDPYHSSPNWRLPYPEAQARQIHELVEACRRARVDFVWAIHPGKDIQWNETDYQNLTHKFDLMYDLGVRHFAIHFDDIDGEGTNPVRQVELLNRLTREWVEKKGDVAPLTVCPTDYSRLWAQPGPTGPLAIYGNQLEKNIRVFWTGDVVCSDLTRETLDWVDQRIKRPAYYWWNFPVTDYARHIVMQGPSYGLEPGLTDQQLCGLLSNPMEHGEASKLALYGVADYCWNTSAYNALDNWERALADLTPEAAAAYRTFAIHSCDTETGYRRAESWETKTFRPDDNFSQEEYNALAAELQRVVSAPQQMRSQCRNQLLLQELDPWLTEFGHLGERCQRTLDLIKLYRAGQYEAFWAGYVDNLLSAEQLAAYNAHKSGTMVLQPFYENSMNDMAVGFFEKTQGYKPDFYQTIGSYATLRTTQGRLMLDGDTATYYHSGESQATGQWVGLDLVTPHKVSEVRVMQGRNSVDDVDYYDNVVLEASLDGRTWTPLTGELQKTYVITWKGEPVDARYVRIRKIESEKKSWIAVREFLVNPVTPETCPVAVEVQDLTAAMLAFDRNPVTACRLDGDLRFSVDSKTTTRADLMLRLTGSHVTARQLDAKGNTLTTTDITQPYTRLDIQKGATHVVLSGQCDVHEVVMK